MECLQVSLEVSVVSRERKVEDRAPMRNEARVLASVGFLEVARALEQVQVPRFWVAAGEGTKAGRVVVMLGSLTKA